MSEFTPAHQEVIRRAAENPDRPFMLQPVDGVVHSYTWSDCERIARCMASALIGLGLERGDKVAILAKNSVEWVLADVAVAMAGLISVPIFPTANGNTIAYVLGHSEAKAVFIGKLDEPGVAAEAVPDSLDRIAFPYQVEAFDHRWQDLVDTHEPLADVHRPNPDETMTILYTSGSTGRPKGVVLSYGAYFYGSIAARDAVKVNSEDRAISYLPLAHITERTVTIGPVIYSGATCSFVESLQTFNHDVKTARPTLFLSVPRLWVKFQAGIHAKIPPRKLRLLLAIPIVGSLVARRIRRELGFENCRHFGSGTAPISPLTLKWYRKLGINIGEGWGMSETSGLACANAPFDARRLGTIGVPVAGTEMKISDAGELLLRSPGLMTEYYKQPDLTRESMTEDGFFRTGDKAEFDERTGSFRITGRVKDIFKSAKGKYVTPVPIEGRLSGNPLIEQVCVMGAGLPAPVAVVVLSDAARHLPQKNVESNLSATLIDVNEHLESHERMSHVVIVRDEWTTENGLLTPTLKIKRAELEDRYGDLAAEPQTGRVAWQAA